MSRSTPSLLALLGLVAVAGYQNRAKISEMLDSSKSRTGPDGEKDSGLLSQIGEMFQSGSGGLGSTVSGGLEDLIARFKNAGQGGTADSWVASGSNVPLNDTDLESAIGDETLAEISLKTGLSRSELLRRLSTSLPDLVNDLTPDGRLPTASEAQALA